MLLSILELIARFPRAAAFFHSCDDEHTVEVWENGSLWTITRTIVNGKFRYIATTENR